MGQQKNCQEKHSTDKKIPFIELKELSFSDSNIISMNWVNDGDDLLINIDWLKPIKFDPNSIGSNLAVVLNCIYVTNMKMDIEFNESMGYLSIFKIDMKINKDNIVDVEIKFLGIPDGYIHFLCSDIYLSYEEEKSDPAVSG